MAYDPSDDVTARALLEAALALDSTPTLATATVDMVFDLAASLDADEETVYLASDLNKSAALGWNLKAGLTADAYDIGGGNGKYLTRSQWFEHCKQMAQAYGSGQMSVTGDSTLKGGIRVAGLITSTSADYWETTS